MGLPGQNRVQTPQEAEEFETIFLQQMHCYFKGPRVAK